MDEQAEYALVVRIEQHGVVRGHYTVDYGNGSFSLSRLGMLIAESGIMDPDGALRAPVVIRIDTATLHKVSD